MVMSCSRCFARPPDGAVDASVGAVRSRPATTAPPHEDFASLRLCRAAGDTVSAELEREFTALSGFVIDEAYGLTEAGLVTVSPPSGRIKLGSVGQVVPGVSVRSATTTARNCRAASEGRLWIKTRAATVGYWDDPDATGRPSVMGGSTRAM